MSAVELFFNIIIKEDRTKTFTTGAVYFYTWTSITISDQWMQTWRSAECVYTCTERQLTVFLLQLLTTSWRIHSRGFNIQGQVFANLVFVITLHNARHLTLLLWIICSLLISSLCSNTAAYPCCLWNTAGFLGFMFGNRNLKSKYKNKMDTFSHNFPVFGVLSFLPHLWEK